MQQQQKYFIKGMVCQRCITTVKTELENIGLQLEDINLGEVTLAARVQFADTLLLEEKLKPLGFSLVEDKKNKLIKDIKSLVEKVYAGNYDFPHHFRFSELATIETGKDYDMISSLFSATENITIEKYIILYRIEKIKEMLVYTNNTLADISFRLGFSSVAHLSRQFKLQTGLNPSHFKSIKQYRQPADEKS